MQQPARPSRVRWHRPLVNFWLDATMLIIFVTLVGVTTIIRFVFPPASSADGWLLWSRTLDEWIHMQFVLVAVFTFAVLLHLILHWTWVCGILSSRMLPRAAGGKRQMDDGTRTIVGVGLLITILNLLGVAIAAAALMITGP